MSPERPPASIRARWYPTPVACAVGVAALYAVFVGTTVGQRLDRAAVLRHNLDRLVDGDVHRADVVLLAWVLFLVPVVAWLARRSWRAVLALCGSLAVAAGVAEALQHLLPRPALLAFNPLYTASFPSGHAAASMALALGLLTVAADRAWARWLATAVPAITAAIAIGYPIHRPSDLAAGYLIALAVVWTIVRGPFELVHPVTAGPDRALVSVLRVVVVSLVAVGAEAAYLRRPHLTVGQLGPWWLPSIVALTAAAELVTASWRGASE